MGFAVRASNAPLSRPRMSRPRAGFSSRTPQGKEIGRLLAILAGRSKSAAV